MHVDMPVSKQNKTNQVNGPGDRGSIVGQDIRRTQTMVLDTSFLNTQHYKVSMKGKVEKSMEGVDSFPVF